MTAKKHQNFTGKPQVGYFVCLFGLHVWRHLRRDTVQSFIQKFAYRNVIKLYRMLFYKSNKKMQRKPGVKMFSTFAGMRSFMLKLEIWLEHHKTLHKALSP